MPPTLTWSVPGCEVTAVSQRDHGLTITAHTTASTATCPRCGLSSRRMHRDDIRRPRDLPLWASAGCVVRRVRRFRCLHATGTVQTCAERLAPSPAGGAAHGALDHSLAASRARVVAKPGRGWAPSSMCPPALILCGGSSASCRICPRPRRPSLGSMIGPCVGGTPLAPCWSTWSASGRSRCGLTARPLRVWRGSRHIQASSA